MRYRKAVIIMLEILMLLLGLFALGGGFVLEGGHLTALFTPTALMIVFGGTIGAVGLSFSLKELKTIPKTLIKVFAFKKKNEFDIYEKTIAYYKEISIKLRKENFTFIEKELETNKELDSMTRKGLQLFVDGFKENVAKNILENYYYAEEELAENQASIFEAAGGFGPTMGIIGTVMGLVHVLGNLDDPDTLGTKIAVAFVATLYGVASANLLWLPIASKIKLINSINLKNKQLCLEGSMCLIESVNSYELEERLKSIIGDCYETKKKNEERK